MKRCVIIAGGEIKDYTAIKKYLRPDDFYIYCDSGLTHKTGLGVGPNLIVGDFDSHQKPKTDIETIVLPCQKEDTDSVFAVKEAIKRGFDEFVLVGMLGGRVDHSLCNIYLLLYIDSLSKNAVMVTEDSQLSIIGTKPVEVESGYKYFSLVNIDGSAKGITISGAKYNLDNQNIDCSYQYGISNEVISDKAVISLASGRLLLIKVK